MLCSGKIYYDAITDDRRAEAAHVAVGRIELLYPFPGAEVTELLRRYPRVEELVWLQEEPSNMGPRKWVVPQLAALAPEGIRTWYVSRPERSSPAEGYPAAHKAEQTRLVTEALT